MSDEEIHERREPFSPELLADVARFLGDLAFRMIRARVYTSVAACGILDSCLRLLAMLRDRDARRSFMPAEQWLVQHSDLRLSVFRRHLRDEGPHGWPKRVLADTPQVLRFHDRVRLFRDHVRAEHERLGDGDGLVTRPFGTRQRGRLRAAAWRR